MAIRGETITVANETWHRIFGLDLDRHRIGRSLAVRGLGLVYFIAICSWWTQVALLVGKEGLSPAGNLLSLLEERLGATGESAIWALPNVFWILGTSDFAFQFVCFVGAILAILVFLGRFCAPCLILLWIIYLSLVNTGGVFMSFQWDILLLEAGFLGIFLATWKSRSTWRNPPTLSVVNRIALVFFWILIAKLMFFSGWVKLAWAGGAYPEWWPERTAMTYHYMTQPIPTWTAWHVHHWSESFHHFSIWPMYFIELVLPFTIFFGRFGRAAAGIGFVLLMVLILFTGNYTYFNWLTIVLCLPLIHDRLWPEWFHNWLKFVPEGLPPAPVWKVRALKLSIALPVFAILALLNFQVILGDLHRAPNPALKANPTPEWLDTFRAKLEPFRLASGYGLFRTMTTERPEIILEGSWDGTSWFEYDFAWKIDELSDRPKFVAPHQPRVAWQFWFAALEKRFDYRSRNAGWIESIVIKLLQDDPDVESLIKHNPFPNSPPRLIRARLFNYEFTTPEERARTGDWWKRVAVGEYLSPVSLSEPGEEAPES
ncbi:MAG: lipase maturation factor family protein [Verrucomicrobiales bacterium]|nr:lipase maturation factor family protein [Verrucomicrobiales bacterium]